MPPSKVIYVGYELNDPEYQKKMELIIGDNVDKLNHKIITSHAHFTNTPQQNMINWYEKNKDDNVIGNIKNYYKYETRNVFILVCEININMIRYHVIFANTRNETPITIKGMIDNGSFGKPVILEDPIKLNFKKIKEEGEIWHKGQNRM